MTTKRPSKERRTLYVDEWPEADRQAWREACRPSVRLQRGGSASHLAPVSRDDFATRYGLFLGFLKLANRLDHKAPAAAHVTPDNVQAYLEDTSKRVSSVTAWNCIYKLRRTAELISPKADFSWLAEIEKDIALVMEPRSKLDRLVFAEQLVEAGLTLIVETQGFATTKYVRARGIRNGLMVALLALCPTRPKNFASLELKTTFRQIEGKWWATLPGRSTKMHRPEERPLPEWVNPYIEPYLSEARPVLLRARNSVNALWISSTGNPMNARDVGKVITKTTKETIGIAISPHLFRTADATTAADSRSDLPHLASALLGHTDPRVTEEHYNRGTSITAAKAYADLLRSDRSGASASITSSS
jgi:integrase